MKRARSFQVASIIRVGIQIALAPALARLMGPDARGALFIIVLLDAVTSELFLRGIPQALVRAPGMGDLPPIERLATAQLLAVRSSLVSAPAGLVVSLWFILSGSPPIMALLAFVLIAGSGLEIAAQSSRYMQANTDGDYGLLTYNVLVAGMLWQIPVLILYLIDYGSVGAAGTFLLLGKASSVFLAIRGSGLLKTQANSRTISREVRPYARKIAVSTYGQLIQGRIDQLWAVALLDTSQLGQLAVALLYTAPVTAAATALSQTNFLSGEQTLRAIYKKGLFLIAISVATACSAALLNDLVFGSQFGDARVSGILFSLSALFFGSFLLLRSYLDVIGRPEISAAGQVCGVITSVVCAPVLVLRFGVSGVAATALVSNAVRALVLVGWTAGLGYTAFKPAIRMESA